MMKTHMDALYQELFPIHKPMAKRKRNNACAEVFSMANSEYLNNLL